jgi:hypothetical protein
MKMASCRGSERNPVAVGIVCGSPSSLVTANGSWQRAHLPVTNTDDAPVLFCRI